MLSHPRIEFAAEFLKRGRHLVALPQAAERLVFGKNSSRRGLCQWILAEVRIDIGKARRG
jgi:hypothetical protein